AGGAAGRGVRQDQLAAAVRLHAVGQSLPDDAGGDRAALELLRPPPGGRDVGVAGGVSVLTLLTLRVRPRRCDRPVGGVGSGLLRPVDGALLELLVAAVLDESASDRGGRRAQLRRVLLRSCLNGLLRGR